MGSPLVERDFRIAPGSRATRVRRERRRVSVGVTPTRQLALQPVAIGAANEVTTSPKPSMSRATTGGSASSQAVTRVNAKQAPKRRDGGADPARLRGRPT